MFILLYFSFLVVAFIVVVTALFLVFLVLSSKVVVSFVSMAEAMIFRSRE